MDVCLLVKRSFHFRQTIAEKVITASEPVLCCKSKEVKLHHINKLISVEQAPVGEFTLCMTGSWH